MSFEIIVPFYNEAHRLKDTVLGLSAEKIDPRFRFWWADDGSSDGSSEVLQKLINSYFPGSLHQHKIIRVEQNRGKGAIVRHAIGQLKQTVSSDSVVAFWDSDGELGPSGLFEALELVGSRRADIVFGSRFSKRNPQVLNYRHYLGNKALTVVSNWFSNLNLSDVHCCARILRAEILFQLPLSTDGFDFEAEFVGLVGRIKSPKLRLIEVPLDYVPRTVDEGKKIGLAHVWPQIVQALRCRYFVKPLTIQLEAALPNPRFEPQDSLA